MTYTPPPSDPNAGQAGGYSQPASTPQYSTYGQGSYGDPSSNYSTAYTGAKPKSDKKTFGLWALILGISSIIIPLGLNGVAGIALGIVGLIKENSKGMSITGIVTGAIGLIWAPIAWTLLAGLLTYWALAATTY